MNDQQPKWIADSYRELAGHAIDVHAEVVMDSQRDQEQHDRAVELMRRTLNILDRSAEKALRESA